MPLYAMKAPNGKTYRIPGPAGATDDEIKQEILKQHPDAAGAPEAAPSTGGIPEGRKGTRYDFLPPTSQIRQLGNMFDVVRDVLASTANKPSAQPAHAVIDPFLDIISGVKRGTEDLTQGLPALFGLPGAREYKNQKEAQYQNVTQNRTAAAVPRLATQAAIAYGGTGGLGSIARGLPVVSNALRTVAPALKVTPEVAETIATALESGGFKAPNVLAKVVAGGTTGAGGALLTDQDLSLIHI